MANHLLKLKFFVNQKQVPVPLRHTKVDILQICNLIL